MEQTEKELVDLHRTFFWQSEKIIKSDKWEHLDKLYHKLPADLMNVNDQTTMALRYVDPIVRRLVGLTEENILTKGATEVARRVDPANLAKNFKIGQDFVQRGNKHEVGVLFQKFDLNPIPGGNYEWYVSFMKMSDNAKGLFTLNFKIKFLDKYQHKFMKLIEWDEFVHQNMNKFQELSPREIEILSKVAIGNSSFEIADELFISKHTVDTHRKNIMNKLGINRFVDLIRFAEAFDLV